MSCKSTVSLPQNAVLDAGTVSELRKAATLYFNVPKPGLIGRKFKSAADYVQYKKAESLAGSSNGLLPPQSNVITQLQGNC